VIKVEAEDEPTFFKEIARAQELFCFDKCGVCDNLDVSFRCRIDREENEWLEIVCNNLSCRAKLPFGQTKKTQEIYPKTRWNHLSETQQEQRESEKTYAESHNGFLPNGGWFIYRA
jgi:hypothetical protein